MARIIIDEPNRTRREIELDGGSYAIGRSNKNDIVIFDETVSRFHCRISFNGTSLAVKDLNSSSGVYINGIRIQNEALLEDRDRVKIGMTTLGIEAWDKGMEETVLPNNLLMPQGIKVTENEEIYNENNTICLEYKLNEAKSKTNCYMLLILSGPEKGAEHLLDQPEMLIGRSQKCQIYIKDKTISKQHSMLCLNRNSYTIKDMNSLNGTFVNGEPVKTARLLEDNDVIKCGNTSFRFSGQKKIEARKYKRDKILIGATLFCIAILLLFLIFLNPRHILTSQYKKDIIEGDLYEDKDSVKDKNNNIAHAYKITADELLQNQLWDEAAKKYEEALRLDPFIPGVQEGIKKADFEQKNKYNLEKGQERITNEEYDSGISLLESITQDSFYYNQAFLELQRARDERRKLREKEKKADMEQKAIELKSRAIRLYISGNLEASINCLNRLLALGLPSESSLVTQARVYREEFEVINNLFEKGLNEYKNGRFNEAVQVWTQVVSIDNELIGRSRSHFSNQIAQYIAEECYQRASAFYESQNLEGAQENCKKCLEAIPGHKGCQGIKDRLNDLAKSL